jgi:mannose-6-phosphate isomerase-like protein (cupin superfamily)
MDQEKIKKDWAVRAYSFGIFKDPPGKVWADFVHRTDELIVLAEGEIEIKIEGKSEQPTIGREVIIPANVIHTVSNVGKTNNVWYYGYKNACEDKALVPGSKLSLQTQKILKIK